MAGSCALRRAVHSMPEAPGEIDVHQDHVGFVAGNLFKRLFRRAARADTADAGRPAQHALQIAAQRRAVFNQCDRGHNVLPDGQRRPLILMSIRGHR
jgi:hypothetical protein